MMKVPKLPTKIYSATVQRGSATPEAPPSAPRRRITLYTEDGVYLGKQEVEGDLDSYELPPDFATYVRDPSGRYVRQVEGAPAPTAFVESGLDGLAELPAADPNEPAEPTVTEVTRHG
jgi:hypothetical protein